MEVLAELRLLPLPNSRSRSCSTSAARFSRDSGVSSEVDLRITCHSRVIQWDLPFTSISPGSKPKSVGTQTTPFTRSLLSTKSIMRQSFLPVCGDNLIPRPI